MAKTFKIVKTRIGQGTEYFTEGTLEQLIESHRYTLECGYAYQQEKGNSKINISPKSISQLVVNLNKAVNNSAANGYAGVHYTYFETVIA